MQVTVVTDFLTFDGIMVAAAAIISSSRSDSFFRAVLLISIEFVTSAVLFLLSFRGVIGTASAFVHVGDAVRLGLTLSFAGVVSLLFLMLGAYLDELLN
jgi:hypothetical protein